MLEEVRRLFIIIPSLLLVVMCQPVGVALVEELSPALRDSKSLTGGDSGLGGRRDPGDALVGAGQSGEGSADSTTLPSSSGSALGSGGEPGIASLCGNGRRDGAEVCDDGGNPASGFGCNNVCTAQLLPVCGDGNITGTETCDDGPMNGIYCQDCALSTASCGDGVLQSALETCDGSGETRLCNIDCSTARCGDAMVNLTAGEICDDGVNDNLRGGCTSDCKNFALAASGATQPSCKKIRETEGNSPPRSGVYWLSNGGGAYVAYCDMVTDGGGWNLILRVIDSNFAYDDLTWTTATLENENNFDLLGPSSRSKYQAFNQVPFNEVRTSSVNDFLQGFSAIVQADSALAFFGADGGKGVGVEIAVGPGALVNHFDELLPFDARQWGCDDYINVGFNQVAQLNIQRTGNGATDVSSIKEGLGAFCNWDGGARFGQRVNGCNYAEGSQKTTCHGDHIGQGWGNLSNRVPRQWPTPMSQLLWVR